MKTNLRNNILNEIKEDIKNEEKLKIKNEEEKRLNEKNNKKSNKLEKISNTKFLKEDYKKGVVSEILIPLFEYCLKLMVDKIKRLKKTNLIIELKYEVLEHELNKILEKYRYYNMKYINLQFNLYCKNLGFKKGVFKFKKVIEKEVLQSREFTNGNYINPLPKAYWQKTLYKTTRYKFYIGVKSHIIGSYVKCDFQEKYNSKIKRKNVKFLEKNETFYKKDQVYSKDIGRIWDD